MDTIYKGTIKGLKLSVLRLWRGKYLYFALIHKGNKLIGAVVDNSESGIKERVLKQVQSFL